MRAETRFVLQACSAAHHGQTAADVFGADECLCRKWFPFEKKCHCQVPLAAAVNRQSSMPELRGKEQTKPLMEPKARNQLMMHELQKLGLTELPSYQRMRNSSTREGLLRAREAGELGGLRSAIRAARSYLGMEDPLVKLVGKVLSEAERCSRSCRDCLAMDDLDVLPSAMSKIEAIAIRVKELGLGSGVWEDPYLGAARRRLSSWKQHRRILESLAAKRQEGVPSYCDAWALLALQSSDEVKAEFGQTVTKELVSLPDAGVELVRTIARMFSELRGPPEENIDAAVETIMRFSWMLSQLDRGQLDDLLLKPSSKGGSSLQVAALQEDILPFCALYQTISGEVVDIQRDLQLWLEKDAQLTPRPSCQLAAARIGELLQLDPEHLCLRRLPGKGLALRLLVAAGQPPAQQAQQVLGSGAAVQTWGAWRRLPQRIEELSTWHNAGNCVMELYDAQGRCRITGGAAKLAEAAAVEDVARLEEAKAVEAKASEEADAAEARVEEATRRQEEVWQVFVARMQETQKTMRRASMVHNEVEVEEAKARDAEAEQDHKAAKAHRAAVEADAVEAAELLETAQSAVAEAAERAEESMEASVRATTEAKEAASRYQEILHTPLTSTPLRKTRPSSRAKSAPQEETLHTPFFTPSRKMRPSSRAQRAPQRQGIKSEARPRTR